MDFTINEDARALRDNVRRLVDNELIPAEKEVEELDRVPDRLSEMIREMGLCGLTIPEEYGGIGLDCLSTTLVLEQIGRAHSAFRAAISTNNGIGSKALIHSGTEEQKQSYLPRIASGEWLAAFALTEPEAGSDAAAIRTTAERKGDEYVLNGLKHFITNGPEADVVTVMALTDPEKKARGGISAFIVERGTPGLRVARVQKTMGPGGYHQGELVFEDCAIPAENRLGEEGEGLRIALQTLNHGRVVLAAAAVGLAQRMLDMSLEHAKLRVQFGRPLSKFQAIQFKLADMATAVHTSRLLVRHSAWLVDQGQPARGQAAMAKLYATEALGRVADEAVQIFGGMGYMCELPIERMYREARLYRIVEGTSEIQRIVISRDLLSD